MPPTAADIQDKARATTVTNMQHTHMATWLQNPHTHTWYMSGVYARQAAAGWQSVWLFTTRRITTAAWRASLKEEHETSSRLY
jgi:hypothetical protein